MSDLKNFDQVYPTDLHLQKPKCSRLIRKSNERSFLNSLKETFPPLLENIPEYEAFTVVNDDSLFLTTLNDF